MGHFLVRRASVSVYCVLFSVLGDHVRLALTLRPSIRSRSSMGKTTAMVKQQAEARVKLGLDSRLLVQIGRGIKKVFSGDWALSLMTKRPVLKNICITLPYTLEFYLLFGAADSALIDIPLGVISANRKAPATRRRVAGRRSVGLISILTFWLTNSPCSTSSPVHRAPAA